MDKSVYIIQRVLEYGDQVFISEVVCVTEDYEKAAKIVEKMPDQTLAKYEIYEYKMNETYFVDGLMGEGHIDSWEELEEALEGLIQKGVVETLIGEDGEFYYKLSEGVNGIDR